MLKENAITQYIKENWDKTIWDNKDDRNGDSFVWLKKPYTVPCIQEQFTIFFYWDTYFANLGLFIHDRAEQVENNLDNMQFFIKRLGYIPNASRLINRSQPPVFTRGVYDLYKFKQDKSVIEKYLDDVLAELQFWKNDRMTPCGLSAYKHSATNTYLIQFCDTIGKRLDLSKESGINRISLGADLLAIAESGWDFNPRFMTENNRFAASEFAHLELNCLLYDAERKAAEMAAIVDRKDDAKRLYQEAATRKALMDRFMKDEKSGVYYDYNFKTGTLSKVLSCASLYVYALGISDDKNAAKAVLERLELPHGIAACEEVKGEPLFQWGYPSMWPTNIYFAALGLDRLGLKEEGFRVAKKYTDCVENVFGKTGTLWEKYDAQLGAVSVTAEYKTPAMLGWTAGIYLFLKDYYSY